MPPRVFIILLACISICAGVLLAYSTPAGIGLTNDSVAYIGGARSILAGTGYSDIWLESELEPITHYPPLLSLTLGGFGLLGIDPLRGARLLNILLFGANTALAGLLGWRMTRRPGLGLLLAVLFGMNAQTLRVHAFALSEPLFLFLSLISFLFFDFAIQSQAGKLAAGWLLATGFCAGLAFLTRYSGLALIAAFLLSTVIIFQSKKLLQVSLFLAGAVPPIAAWFLRNKLVADTATNRSFEYHPILWENVRVGFYNLSQFLVPVEPWRRDLMKSGALPGLFIAAGLALLTWLAFQSWKLLFKGERLPTSVAFTTGVYAFGYLCAILFSMSFFDASTKFQHRILLPLYLAWMTLLVAGLGALMTRATRSQGRSLGSLASWAAVLFILGLSILDYQQTVVELRGSAGLGYGSWQWRDSQVMAELKALPPDVTIYTNSPPAVYFVTGRPSRVIPTPLDPVDNLPRGDYEQNLALMREELLAGRAVLALFDTSDIEGALGLEEIDDFSSGLAILKKAQGDILYGRP
jgi:hypothetical protein